MTPFCTSDQYRQRYPDDETPDVVLAECLMDATDEICIALDHAEIEYSDPGESFTRRLMRVCRDVARRALGASGGASSSVPLGATQASVSQGAGGYTATRTFTLANPYGEVRVLPSDLRRLGVDDTACGWSATTCDGPQLVVGA